MGETTTKLLGSFSVGPDILEESKKIEKLEDLGKSIEKYSQNITTLLGVILCVSVLLDASDVHIEPQKDKAKLRIRLDGILHDVAFFTLDTYRSFLSRVKILSQMKINIAESPQDGRFTVVMEDKLIEVRTSTLPLEWGESIMMRILNPRNLMSLETLDVRRDLYLMLVTKLPKMIEGMILVAGPTGSGKTTTIYAFLKKIQDSGIKIITIEDPIEYHLEGVSQTQVDPEKSYNFAKGLGSIMRQDPDVILVGEVRDSETANIALQASLTGHLVLATIHANDVASILARLVNLKADLVSISSALKLLVSQRLVRKVCEECSTMAKPLPEDLAEIKKGLQGIWKKMSVKLLEGAPGLPKAKLPADLNEIKIAKVSDKPCNQCNSTGYKGRKGIFEMFFIDAELEKFILTNPSTTSIRELLIKKGMITIYQSGLMEVVLGGTTLSEVRRVIEAG